MANPRDPRRADWTGAPFAERSRHWQGDADQIERYDRRFAGLAGSLSNRRTLALCRALLGSRAGRGPILDLPCGTGRLLPLFAAAGLPSVEADISLDMIAAARRKMAPAQRVTGFVRLDVFALPFRDRALGGACVLRFTQHLSHEERVRALRELARVSSGPLVVSYHHGYTLKRIGRRVRKRLGLFRGALRGVTRADVRADAEASGLAIAGWRSVFPVLSGQWIVAFVRPPAAG